MDLPPKIVAMTSPSPYQGRKQSDCQVRLKETSEWDKARRITASNERPVRGLLDIFSGRGVEKDPAVMSARRGATGFPIGLLPVNLIKVPATASAGRPKISRRATAAMLVRASPRNKE